MLLKEEIFISSFFLPSYDIAHMLCNCIKYLLPFLMFLFYPEELYSQAFTINIKPMYYGHIIQIDHPVIDSVLGEQVTFKECKFYLGKFTLYSKDTILHFDRYHLIDIENANTTALSFPIPPFFYADSISFLLGIDSVTNISGIMDGDLDPLNGMYWAWNSGYINMKIEGITPKCPGRNNLFQFHIGGYQAPYQTAQNISFAIKRSQNIEIQMNVQNILEKVQLSKEYQIMSPGKKAKEMSESMSTMFSILQ
jgi:hypothetical protein